MAATTDSNLTSKEVRLGLKTDIYRVFPSGNLGYKASAGAYSNMSEFFIRVNEFNGRDLTYEVDALAAFQGVLNSFLRHDYGHLHSLLFRAPGYSTNMDSTKYLEAEGFVEALLWYGCHVDSSLTLTHFDVTSGYYRHLSFHYRYNRYVWLPAPFVITNPFCSGIGIRCMTIF